MNPVENIQEGTQVTKMLLKEIERPVKTFYYRRIKTVDVDPYAPITLEDDYDFIAFKEEEAARLNPAKFQQLGVSDGTVFFNTLKASGMFGKWLPVQDAKKLYRDAEIADFEACKGKLQRPFRSNVYTLGDNLPNDIIQGFK